MSNVCRDRSARSIGIVDPIADRPGAIRRVNNRARREFSRQNRPLDYGPQFRWESSALEGERQTLEHLIAGHTAMLASSRP